MTSQVRWAPATRLAAALRTTANAGSQGKADEWSSGARTRTSRPVSAHVSARARNQTCGFARGDPLSPGQRRARSGRSCPTRSRALVAQEAQCSYPGRGNAACPPHKNRGHAATTLHGSAFAARCTRAQAHSSSRTAARPPTGVSADRRGTEPEGRRHDPARTGPVASRVTEVPRERDRYGVEPPYGVGETAASPTNSARGRARADQTGRLVTYQLSGALTGARSERRVKDDARRRSSRRRCEANRAASVWARSGSRRPLSLDPRSRSS